MYKTFDATEIAPNAIHRLIVGAIAPRPIAFASTVNAMGQPNLAPFSFFNAFGVNPTTIIFSPARRGRDNTTKHTFENIKEVPEVVINAVTYSMVEQVSLASAEFPQGISEFEKAGFTPLASDKVKPFRVKESPVQWECKVRQVIETGTGGGAANLIICEVVMVHVRADILTDDGNINTSKIDLVGRMGTDYYVRAHGEALFEVEKPYHKPAIGIDALPFSLKNSPLLTGNELGRLGSVEAMPSPGELAEARSISGVHSILNHSVLTREAKTEKLHQMVREALQQGNKRHALILGWLLEDE
ncbi:MAG: flavin reductase family protein [Lentimicrobium sp.]|jgi:flavin reductase (DIM6/NTAB) family NADH-FMN oxidoreductase RutF|nr:flavin reductase family protein [Lentimicrobium sp.]MDD2528351.1 flavin reductase family protein [Lentimicrobiaceae bacterium]MDD4598508.1 flavin reductase family protein [Lentimicrobiaceae bacterium]MDY0025683.1 flavin reductase family protein [Lentimicrobium sp.]HAH59857.1 flavin reductase [Bacteroidales bacterium]